MRKLFFPVLEQNPHLKKVEAHFGKIRGPAAELPDETSFVFVCFTNRCGSNYLAELMASGGDYNVAGEDLNWDTVINHSNRLNLESFQAYFSFLARHLRRSERVFIKAATSQIELLGRAGILDQVIARSKFILIERNDKLGQAISHAIAFATGRFTSHTEGIKTAEEVEYSRKQIEQIIGGIAEQYRQFDVFFGRNGLTPLCIAYEQLITDPQAHLAVIARHLGVEALVMNPERLRLERQTGPVNAAWRERYLTED